MALAGGKAQVSKGPVAFPLSDPEHLKDPGTTGSEVREACEMTLSGITLPRGSSATFLLALRFKICLDRGDQAVLITLSP